MKLGRWGIQEAVDFISVAKFYSENITAYRPLDRLGPKKAFIVPTLEYKITAGKIPSNETVLATVLGRETSYEFCSTCRAQKYLMATHV